MAKQRPPSSQRSSTLPGVWVGRTGARLPLTRDAVGRAGGSVMPPAADRETFQYQRPANQIRAWQWPPAVASSRRSKDNTLSHAPARFRGDQGDLMTQSAWMLSPSRNSGHRWLRLRGRCDAPGRGATGSLHPEHDGHRAASSVGAPDQARAPGQEARRDVGRHRRRGSGAPRSGPAALRLEPRHHGRAGGTTVGAGGTTVGAGGTTVGAGGTTVASGAQ